jgi:predicted acylesterase/phospholipase RssA
MSEGPSCILDASIVLDYYRHSTGADYLPAAKEIVGEALSHFSTVHAEFVVGHSRFAQTLQDNPEFAAKLSLLSQANADSLVNRLSSDEESQVDALYDLVLSDSILTAARAASASQSIRSLGDEIGYVLRLAIIGKQLGVTVVLAPGRYNIAEAMSRQSGVAVDAPKIGSLDQTAVMVAGTLVYFAGLVAESKGRPRRGYSLIMKGGGIKGLAYAGALQELANYYAFDTFVGTSAGAIAAAYLAAGWSPSELQQILADVQFRDFVSFNPVFLVRNLLLHGGLFDGGRLEGWIEEHLRQKMGVTTTVTFGDLPYEALIPVSTARRGTIVFGKTSSPRSSVAYAARCSASLPYFFTPGNWEGGAAVDAGTQHNLPVRPFLEEKGGRRFLILTLVSSPKPGRHIDALAALRITQDLLGIWLDQDEDSIMRTYRRSVIAIGTGKIGTTKLKLTDKERGFLLTSGRLAALRFLETQGFSEVSTRRVAFEEEMRASYI